MLMNILRAGPVVSRNAGKRRPPAAVGAFTGGNAGRQTAPVAVLLKELAAKARVPMEAADRTGG
ncbi:MAG: hypothetical protein ABI270_00520 [Nitrosospira sp.]